MIRAIRCDPFIYSGSGKFEMERNNGRRDAQWNRFPRVLLALTPIVDVIYKSRTRSLALAPRSCASPAECMKAKQFARSSARRVSGTFDLSLSH